MYIVIQSCFGYEKYLYNILKQLAQFSLIDIIIIYNQAKNNNIIQDKYYNIFTTDNFYELSSFKQIFLNYQFLDKFKKFLFLHDTINLGSDFLNRLHRINNLLDSRSFDWAPLSTNYQCMMGIADRNFIIDKFGIYTKLPNISKKDAIDIELGRGIYADYSLRYLSENPIPLGGNPRVKNSKSSFLDGNERVEIYFESLDLYKYFKYPKIFVT